MRQAIVESMLTFSAEEHDQLNASRVSFVSNLRDFLSDADRRMIMGGTTCRLLGLDFLSD